MAKPVPDGFRTITPYLVVRGANGFLAFLQAGFGGRVDSIVRRPDGEVMNAAVTIGDSAVMVSNAPTDREPTEVWLYLYVDDCDAWYKRALDAGATSIMEPADMFYGDRHGGVKDAWGNTWWLATHIEDVTEEEVERRASRRETRPTG